MSGGHGTYGSYSRPGGCRCAECREAARLYRRGQRARRLSEGTIVHGYRAGYDCGCRCPDCTEAKRVGDLESRRRIRAARVASTEVKP